MKRIDLVFKRAGKFVMRGAVSVDVDDTTDWRSQAELLKFAEFLPMNIEYTDDTWEFDTVYKEKTNENT